MTDTPAPAPAPAMPRPGPDEGRLLPDHVTAPLLTVITQRSLDADYEHVAARRRAGGETAGSRPMPRTAGLVLLVFGVLVTVAAVQTSRNASASDASRESLIKQVDLRRHGLSSLQKELNRAEEQVLGLQANLTQLSTQRQAVQARLDRLSSRTGFGTVRGPGVRVTLASAPGASDNDLVRDSDLTLLTDALWASGAEAISVNGERVTALSAFRNVGVGVLLNARPINPPYVFEVLGNPDTLPANLLSSPIGAKWYALKNSLGFRFEVSDGGTMTLPALGQEPLRYAQAAPPAKGHTRTQGDSSP